MNLLIAYKKSRSWPYQQVVTFDILNSGMSIDNIPFVELNNGLIFYGYTPSQIQRYIYRYFIDKRVRAKVSENAFGVLHDISLRYLGPLSAKNYVREGKYYDLKKGEIVIEVGAFIGYYAMRAAELVGKLGLVVAIEAVDENIQILKKNVDANSNLNIKIVPKAVWKETGTLKLFRIARQQATAIHQSSKKREEIVVPCDTVDNILETLKIERPDFIRLQVNGAEIEVLKGMPKTLSQFPKLLIAAIYKISGQQSWKKAESLLRDRAYETFNVCGNVFARKANKVE